MKNSWQRTGVGNSLHRNVIFRDGVNGATDTHMASQLELKREPYLVSVGIGITVGGETGVFQLGSEVLVDWPVGRGRAKTHVDEKT